MHSVPFVKTSQFSKGFAKSTKGLRPPLGAAPLPLFTELPIAGCNDVGAGELALWNGALNSVPYLLAQLF